MRTIVPVPSWDDVVVPEDGDLVRRADLVAAYQALANRDEFLRSPSRADYSFVIDQSSGNVVLSKEYDAHGDFSHSGSTITFPRQSRWLVSIGAYGEVDGSGIPRLSASGRHIFGRNDVSPDPPGERTVTVTGNVVIRPTQSTMTLTWSGPRPGSEQFVWDAHVVIQELPTL